MGGNMDKIGMIASMLRPMLPENPVVVHQKQTRHRPGVPYRPTDPIALERCLEATPPDAMAKKLVYAPTFEPKGSVKTLRNIGDCPSLRPEPPKEGVALCTCPLREEEYRRISGDCCSNPP
jgi:hypothetical protein